MIYDSAINHHPLEPFKSLQVNDLESQQAVLHLFDHLLCKEFILQLLNNNKIEWHNRWQFYMKAFIRP